MIVQMHHKNIEALANKVDELSQSHAKLAEDHNELIKDHNVLLGLVKELIRLDSASVDNRQLTTVITMGVESRLCRVESFLEHSHNYDVGDKEEEFGTLLEKHGIDLSKTKTKAPRLGKA